MAAPLTPAPGTPQTADKAKVGGALAGIAVAVVVALVRYFDDKNGTNLMEVVSAILIGLGVGGGTGAVVYNTSNRPTNRRA